ncbi:MAG: GNAT family N-acetyltransferase [Candidatus Woesearchaeota archaeon]|jgi:ribosomal protein S18 acetylase RimI-like enzyme|nr:GNAT family N-acetyltransferase [Candidatus Woesearchaeota archaeon]MDP7179927.1 GNAT family N-acetyltransferase [Candidatus Woesearchaeota archaeon]|tara:strand:- start:224 stop:691 length:468 start_codon:yes stop_codon:yes gene_type:complete
MKFRKATANDAIGIATVLKECYNIDSIKEGVEVFKNEVVKGYHYIVADEEGRVAGLVTWQMHGLPKHQLCELDRIAVLSDFRGKGVAQKLFKELVKDSDSEYEKEGFKLRKLYILTHGDNKRAQAFYEKMGCKHETTLKNHFYKGKDEFVFSRFF